MQHILRISALGGKTEDPGQTKRNLSSMALASHEEAFGKLKLKHYNHGRHAKRGKSPTKKWSSNMQQGR